MASRIHILYEDRRGPTNFGLHKFVLAAVQDVLHEQGNYSLPYFELDQRLQANPKKSDGKVLTAIRDDSSRLHGGHSVVVAWLDDDKLHRAVGQRTDRNIVASSFARDKISAVRSFAPQEIQDRRGALKVFLVNGNTEQLLDRINDVRPGVFSAERLQAARDKDLTSRDLCFMDVARPKHADWRAEVRRRDVPFDCMVRFLAQVAVLEPWPPW